MKINILTHMRFLQLVIIGNFLGRPRFWILLVIVDKLQCLSQGAVAMQDACGFHISVFEIYGSCAFQRQGSFYCFLFQLLFLALNDTVNLLVKEDLAKFYSLYTLI